MDKPRPKLLVGDNANTLTSQKTVDFLADLGIGTFYPPDGESWAHGVAEQGIQQVKETSPLIIQKSLPDQDPQLTEAMAASALNNIEYTTGFTAIQWAFGKQFQLGEEELRQQLSLPVDRQQNEFLRPLFQRELAEECARKARARVVLSKLISETAAENVQDGSAGLHVAHVLSSRHLCLS